MADDEKFYAGDDGWRRCRIHDERATYPPSVRFDPIGGRLTQARPSCRSCHREWWEQEQRRRAELDAQVTADARAGKYRGGWDTSG
jgi:transposase-like protein